jgi:hypothetical protein
MKQAKIRDGYAITVDVLGEPSPVEYTATTENDFRARLCLEILKPLTLQVTSWRYATGVMVERFGTMSGTYFPSLAEIEAAERIRDNPEGGR